jgi:hypothetical protein
MTKSVVLAVVVSLMVGGNAFAAKKKKPPSDAQIKQISENAYIYGYPLVLMDMTKQVGTAAVSPTGDRAPVNQFAHFREFPTASFKTVVNPNVDTLYSSAWLDLTAGPIILSVPEMGDRFYVVSIMDAYTNVFADPGTRTDGNTAGNYGLERPAPAGNESRESAHQYGLGSRTNRVRGGCGLQKCACASGSVQADAAQLAWSDGIYPSSGSN